MNRHVAFLRAINTGMRRAKNPQLSEVVEQAGATLARGFLASGNVVFDLDETSSAWIERLESSYLEALGFEVPVIVRSAEEVREITSTQPFPAAELDASEGKLYVGLIKTPPSPDQVGEVLAMATNRDRIAVMGSNLFWLPESGEYLSDLSIPRVEQVTGVLTVRAMSTITRLRDKFL